VNDYMNKVGEHVESFLNGNIGETRVWLKKASKMELLEFIEFLNNEGHNGLSETKRLLR
jgi:hypothetical protein